MRSGFPLIMFPIRCPVSFSFLLFLHHFLLFAGGQINEIDSDLVIAEPFTNETTFYGSPEPLTTLPCETRLRVMTFNTWHSGENVNDGLRKIGKHILAKNLDIVLLQEVHEYVLPALQSMLGPVWSYRFRHPSQTINQKPYVAVLTKHTIVESSREADDSRSINARVRIRFRDNTTEDVNVWCLHLNWECYGPYAACNRMVTHIEQIHSGEANVDGRHPGRMQNVRSITSLREFQTNVIADNLLIVGGDFNSPSHLDWVESTEHKHCGWSYEWPVTKILAGYGLRDAFRELHPDPHATPGDTWSPIYKFLNESGDTWGRSIPEPQDRVDYVMYKRNKSKWRPHESTVYTGDEAVSHIPDHYENDWPSDHASLILEFRRVC